MVEPTVIEPTMVEPTTVESVGAVSSTPTATADVGAVVTVGVNEGLAWSADELEQAARRVTASAAPNLAR